MFVIETIPLLELLIPVTTCAVVDVDELLALILFAVVVLPIVLPEMVAAPAEVTKTPITPDEIPAVAPVVVIEPITLLDITTVPLLEEVIALTVLPLFVLAMVVIDPVPVPLPIVLPLTVPTFTLPVVIFIPAHIPLVLEALLFVDQLKFAIIFP